MRMLKKLEVLSRNSEQAEAHRDAGSGLCAVLRGVRWTAFRHLQDILVFNTVSAKCDVHVCTNVLSCAF